MSVTVNLANKYSSKLVQVYTKESILTGKVNTEYDWTGVKTINVLTAIAQDLNDYDRTASANRYGTPAEVEDSKQDLTLTKDKSFAMVVDRGNLEDQMMAKKAGEVVKMEIGEKVTPFFDSYALGVWAGAAGQTCTLSGTTLDKDTVLDAFIDAHTKFFNQNFTKDLYAFCTSTTYGKLLRNPEFISVDKLGEKVLSNGVVGKCMGIIVVEVPDAYMTGQQILFAHKKSILAPTKIAELKIHTDAPGISGTLIEGRYYGDAFVLTTLNKGVIKCAAAASN